MSSDIDTCGGCIFFDRCQFKGHEEIGYCEDCKEFAFSDDVICPAEIERRERFKEWFKA